MTKLIIFLVWALLARNVFAPIYEHMWGCFPADISWFPLKV